MYMDTKYHWSYAIVPIFKHMVVVIEGHVGDVSFDEIITILETYGVQFLSGRD